MEIPYLLLSRGIKRRDHIRGQTRRPHNNYYHFSHDPHCIHPRHPPRRARRAAEWARWTKGRITVMPRRQSLPPDGRRRQTKAALALDAFVSRPGVDVHTWTTPVAAEFGMRQMDLNEINTFCRFCIRREVTNTHWETCSSPSAAIALLLPSMGLALCVRTFHQCTSHAVWPKKQKGYSMPRVRRAEKIALCSLVSPVVIGYGYHLGRKLRQTSFTIVIV